MSSATTKRRVAAQRRMFVASFYSYKGGVGRSVALMNTAHQLASSGRRVVMLDFDLEAPGLHSASKVPKVWQNGARRGLTRGFIEFFGDYIDQKEVPSITEYMSDWFGPNKLIRLIPAGDLSNFQRYSKNLVSVNKKMNDQDYFARELLLKMRSDLEQEGIDYLLVDSRTGHTDILGATTVLLPHAVVFVTNLAEQSVKGTRDVMGWVHEASKAAVNERHPGQQVPKSPFYFRSIHDPAVQTLIVASPIPFGDYSAIPAAERTLSHSFDHIIYYVPRLAANEAEHVVLDKDDPVKQYRRLTEKIQALNSFEPKNLVESGLDSLSRQDWRLALSYFEAAEHFLGDGDLKRPDQIFALRRQYGAVRALALGFQTKKASALLDSLKSPVDDGADCALQIECVVANLQLVRGHLASNELTTARKPANEAVKYAKKLMQGGRPDPWELIARLQHADVLRLCGEMQLAEEEVKPLPEMAKVLNRAIERGIAYQLLATVQTFIGNFNEAVENLGYAVTEAKRIGVPYLKAGCDFVRSLIDLTQGELRSANATKLEGAAKRYKSEGDGLSEANCLNELAIYNHRLGGKEESTISSLDEALKLYKSIAGTALGQFNVLMYTAEVQSDRGYLAQKNNKMDGALAALCDAMITANHTDLSDADKVPSAWISLLRLFCDTGDFEKIVSAHNLNLEDPTLPPLPQSHSRLSIANCAQERNLALCLLLRRATLEDVDHLEWIAKEAERMQLKYEEAITRTLVSLGCEQLHQFDRRDAQLQRIAALVGSGHFGWSVWGQVNNVSKRLVFGATVKDWRHSASTLLALAQERRLLKAPVYWDKTGP